MHNFFSQLNIFYTKIKIIIKKEVYKIEVENNCFF